MKIIFYDIESFPLKALAWGGFKQYIMHHHILEPTRVACWATKEYGKKSIKFASEKTGHEGMIRRLHTILSEADAVCGYNSVNFDNKMMNSEYLKYGLTPLPPTKQLDLYKVVRRNFRLPSYKLEYIVKHFGLGAKVQHAGFELWTRCMAGERQAWNEMKEYNKGDVELLEALYIKLLPWIQNHPNHNLYGSAKNVCPNCGSANTQSRGYYRTKTGIYKRFACTDCGAWSRNRFSEVAREDAPAIYVPAAIA